MRFKINGNSVSAFIRNPPRNALPRSRPRLLFCFASFATIKYLQARSEKCVGDCFGVCSKAFRLSALFHYCSAMRLIADTIVVVCVVSSRHFDDYCLTIANCFSLGGLPVGLEIAT